MIIIDLQHNCLLLIFNYHIVNDILLYADNGEGEVGKGSLEFRMQQVARQYLQTFVTN